MARLLREELFFADFFMSLKVEKKTILFVQKGLVVEELPSDAVAVREGGLRLPPGHLLPTSRTKATH